jgi:hypothetical protein
MQAQLAAQNMVCKSKVQATALEVKASGDKVLKDVLNSTIEFKIFQNNSSKYQA